MEKFNAEKNSRLIKNLPFSYFSTNLYLDFAAYTFERNGEHFIVWQDVLYQNDFPCIFIPNKKDNWVRCSITFVINEEIENIKKEGIEILVKKPMGSEFFYNTENFINPKSSLKKEINKFITSYDYLLSDNMDKEKIVEFYNFWKKQKGRENVDFEEAEKFFIFCLDNLNKYNIKQIYVEINDKIVGLAWGIEHPNSNNWIALHLKVNYKYIGLSRFLYCERAKMFENFKEFSSGTGTRDKGIDKFKELLGPSYKKEYFYILTGDRT